MILSKVYNGLKRKCFNCTTKSLQYSTTAFKRRGSGVISGGSGGGAYLVKFIDHFGGLSPPKISCIALCFSKFIDLVSKGFSIAMINYALLRGYGDISNC